MNMVSADNSHLSASAIAADFPVIAHNEVKPFRYYHMDISVGIKAVDIFFIQQLSVDIYQAPVYFYFLIGQAYDPFDIIFSHRIRRVKNDYIASFRL